MKTIIALLLLASPAIADKFGSTVRVHRQGPSWSGTVIEVKNGKTLVLTCGHGFFRQYLPTSTPTGVSFYNEDGEYSFPAKLVKMHRNWDLALLEIKGELDTEVAKFADEMPPEYSTVTISGCHYYNKLKRNFTTKEDGISIPSGELLFTANGERIQGLSGGSARNLLNEVIATQSSGTPMQISGPRIKEIRRFLGK